MLDFSGDATPEATAYALKLLTKLRPPVRCCPKPASVAGESSRPGLSLGVHQADRDGRLWAHRVSESQRRASSELRCDRVGERQAGVPARFSEADALSPNAVRSAAAAELAGGGEQDQNHEERGRPLVLVGAGHLFHRGQAHADGAGVLNLTREYFKLVPGRKATDRLSVRAAARVCSSRRRRRGAADVDRRLWRYLLIEDPIPAGTSHREG